MKESRWNSKANWNTPAPGALELVRRFLNTWRIDYDTRRPADELPWLLGDRRAWEERFPDWPSGRDDTEGLLARLREDLRETLDAPEGWAETLNGWLKGYPLVFQLVEENTGGSIQYEPTSGDLTGWILSAVARSIEDGTFSRLKACPDCRWVFYDKSRSKTRVWCGMYAGEGGRACGTISKVKHYRQRRKAGE